MQNKSRPPSCHPPAEGGDWALADLLSPPRALPRASCGLRSPSSNAWALLPCSPQVSAQHPSLVPPAKPHTFTIVSPFPPPSRLPGPGLATQMILKSTASFQWPEKERKACVCQCLNYLRKHPVAKTIKRDSFFHCFCREGGGVAP